MSYRPSTDLDRVVTAAWVPLVDIRRTVQELFALNFSKATDRRGALTNWSNLISGPKPVTRTSRFSEDGSFVCFARSDWANKNMGLIMALGYEEPQNQPGAQGNPAPAAQASQAAYHNNRQQWSFNDAFTSYYNTLRTMTEQLDRGDGIFDRPRFEQQFPWSNVPIVRTTDLQSLVRLVGQILPLHQWRIGNNVARFTAPAWPAVANTVTLDNIGAILDQTPLDSQMFHVWSDGRTGNHRAVVALLRDGPRLLPVNSWIAATAD